MFEKMHRTFYSISNAPLNKMKGQQVEFVLVSGRCDDSFNLLNFDTDKLIFHKDRHFIEGGLWEVPMIEIESIAFRWYNDMEEFDACSPH